MRTAQEERDGPLAGRRFLRDVTIVVAAAGAKPVSDRLLSNAGTSGHLRESKSSVFGRDKKNFHRSVSYEWSIATITTTCRTQRSGNDQFLSNEVRPAFCRNRVFRTHAHTWQATRLTRGVRRDDYYYKLRPHVVVVFLRTNTNAAAAAWHNTRNATILREVTPLLRAFPLDRPRLIYLLLLPRARTIFVLRYLRRRLLFRSGIYVYRNLLRLINLRQFRRRLRRAACTPSAQAPPRTQ